MRRFVTLIALFLLFVSQGSAQFDFDTNFRIQGDGYFLLRDSLDGDRVLVTRRGDFQIDGDGYLVLRPGLRLLGKTGGFVRYRPTVDEDGGWTWEVDGAPEAPSEYGAIKLGSGSSDTSAYPWVRSRELVARNAEGDLDPLGDHSVGSLSFGAEGELLAAKGWQGFVPEVLSNAKALRDVSNEPLWIVTWSTPPDSSGDEDPVRILDNLKRTENPLALRDEEIAEAVSNDFYSILFPNSEYGHGLVPGVDRNGNPYSSFLRQVFLESEVGFDPTINVESVIDDIEATYPRNQLEALAAIDLQTEIEKAVFALDGYSTSSNGEVTIRMKNGDSLVRAQMMLVDFAYPEELERAGDRLYSISPYVDQLSASDGNEEGLMVPGEQGLGMVLGGRLNFPGLLEAPLVTQTQTVGGRYFEGDPAPFGFMYQQGLMSTNDLADLALSGRGFFRLSDPEREGDFYLTRRGAFHVDVDGYLVNECGFRVMGAVGGSIGFRTGISEDGDWLNEVDEVRSDLNTIGELRLDYTIGGTGDGQQSVYYTNDLVGRDGNGKLQYDGDHAVGRLVFDADDDSKVLESNGWQVFLPELVEEFEALVGGESGPDPELRSAIGVALSNDFYTALFPNGRVYPHGLEPGLDGEGRRYRSFVRELLMNNGWSWSEFGSEIWELEQMLPSSQYEAYRIIESMREDHTPKLSRYAVYDDGTVWYFLSNGDSFARARVLLNDVMSASDLIEMGAGCYRVEDEDAIFDPLTLGGDKLYEPGKMGFGIVRQGALEILEENGGVESWKCIFLEGDGYVLLEDPKSEGTRYASKSFEYRVSRDGFVETRDGYRVLGLTGGSVVFRVYVSEWGELTYVPDDVGGVVEPSQYGPLRLTPEVFRAQGRWEPAGPESDPYRDSAIVINDLVADTADGPHRVGKLNWSEDGRLRGTEGWEILVPEARARLWGLSHKKTAEECHFLCLPSMDPAWKELLDNRLYDAILAALSNDVYCSYFPEEVWGHGLVPGKDPNGVRYSSFVEELMAEMQASSGVDLDVVEELADLRASVYIGPEARKRMTSDLVNGNSPWLSGYALGPDGQIWCYPSGGDRFLAGRMLLVEFEAPEQLVEVSEGIWSGVEAAHPVAAEDGNAYSLKAADGVDSWIRAGQYFERPVDRPTFGVGWRGFAGETYTVIKSTDLQNWWSVGKYDGDGSLIEFVDNKQEEGANFYSVVNGEPLRYGQFGQYTRYRPLRKSDADRMVLFDGP